MNTLPDDRRVTVTLTDGKDSVRLHGTLDTEFTALTFSNAQGTWVHRRSEGSASRRWATLRPPFAAEFDLRPLPDRSQDWSWTSLGIQVCLEAGEAVVIEPLAADAAEWVRAHESPAEKRDRLLARFASFDPDAAAELASAIETLVDEARDEGYASTRYDD